MEIRILKYGNLMGSPDMKKLMHDCGGDTAAADKIWDDLYPVKLAFGLNGQSTSALLVGDTASGLLPALVDCSFLCADPASYSEASVTAAVNAVRKAGVEPAEIKSILITHAHGDHLDPRILPHFPNAKSYSHPDSKIPATLPLPGEIIPAGFLALNTPGHGIPHSSYIADLAAHDTSVLIAGDLIMSHAHYLSLDHPLAFTDPEAGRASVTAALAALNSRPTKYRMILPGHDIPFFV